MNACHKRLTKAQVGVARFDLRARVGAFRKRAADLDARLAFDLRARLEAARRRSVSAQLRISSFDFRGKLGALRLRLEQRNHELVSCTERLFRIKREALQRLSYQLQERGPGKVLERGYAIATDRSGNIVRDVDQVSIGDEVRMQLHRGRLTTEVKNKNW